MATIPLDPSAFKSAFYTQYGPKTFVTGVYVQDVAHMSLWQARGVNTMVQAPDGADVGTWSAAADIRGLFQIRQPSSSLAADATNARLLAWAQPDEPSNTSNQFETVSYRPTDLLQMTRSWRDAAAAQGIYKPVWDNHVGNHITPDWALDVEPSWHLGSGLIQDYMQGPETDWLSSDIYQIQSRQTLIQTALGWNSSVPSYVSTPQGIAQDRQTAWSSSNGIWPTGYSDAYGRTNDPYDGTHPKPVMSFIATSAYGGKSQPVPTPGEFNVQAWSSVIHGATGIIYFPVQLRPWQWDTTPSSLVDALTSFNHEIAAINRVVMDTSNGGMNPHRIFRSALQGLTPTGDQLPYGFEASVITADPTNPALTYKIILNMTNSTQTLTSSSLGVINATFTPYEVLRGYNFVTGTSGGESLTAASSSTTMKGYAGNDTLTGQGGDDFLYGGNGSDILIGGDGANAFVFDTAPSNSNIDTINDFKSHSNQSKDTIRLDHLVFTGFNGQGAMGTLPSSMFALNKATTTKHHVIYNDATGAVFYDPDGTGRAAAVQVATVKEPGSTHTLQATDFFVY